MGIIMKTGWADLVINDELTDAICSEYLVNIF